MVFKVVSFLILFLISSILLIVVLLIEPPTVSFFEALWLFFIIYFTIIISSVIAIYSWRFGDYLQKEMGKVWGKYLGEVDSETEFPTIPGFLSYFFKEEIPYIPPSRQKPGLYTGFQQTLAGFFTLLILVILVGGAFLLFDYVGWVSLSSVSTSDGFQSEFLPIFGLAISAIGGKPLALLAVIGFVFFQSATWTVFLLLTAGPASFYVLVGIANISIELEYRLIEYVI
ncbi:hypothetical protein ACFOZ7_05725 [Natribaculum luteum]|uniref:Uncharacterized protein n=1 Tax=Natribaculum luteum TaxID=1586232 RepID=A0ABD5NXG9_9EURY|nr:hypothetical protein [Natribaculum luteum]